MEKIYKEINEELLLNNEVFCHNIKGELEKKYNNKTVLHEVTGEEGTIKRVKEVNIKCCSCNSWCNEYGINILFRVIWKDEKETDITMNVLKLKEETK